MSEQTKDILQQSIDFEYQRFITHVAKSRKQQVAVIDAVAQARSWLGADAKRLGLVDQLGGYQDAIELAAKLANLGEDYDVEFVEAENGFGEVLGFKVRGMIAGAVAPLLPQSALPEIARSLQPVAAELARINRLRDPRNVYMYCVACTAE